jgi:hypothetical protein
MTVQWGRIHTITIDEWRALQKGVTPEGPNVDPLILKPRKERRVKPWLNNDNE